MCYRWQHKDAYTEVNYVITNGKKRWIPHEKHTSEGATLANDGNRKLIKFQMDHLLLPPAASSQQFFASNFKWSIDLLVDSAAGVCYYFIRCKHSEIWSFLKRKSNRLVWPFCSMSSASLEASISSFDVIRWVIQCDNLNLMSQIAIYKHTDFVVWRFFLSIVYLIGSWNCSSQRYGHANMKWRNQN